MSEPESTNLPDDRLGILYAASAYALWGVMPLYWALLAHIPAIEVALHRSLWCALFLAIVLLLRGRGWRILTLMRNRRLLAVLALTSALITANWALFIYCVATHQLIEASLGYYMTPFISFVLGIVFLKERMSRIRIAAMALALGAVLVQTIELGHIPWIGPTLALSFGLYGYFRKLAPVDAADGLLIETWILFPAVAVIIAYLGLTGQGAFPAPTVLENATLIGAGPLTALPLVLFAAGARRIRLTTMGFLQYLSPTITLLLATLFMGESFTRTDAITFCAIWLALLVVSLEGYLPRQRLRLR
ncbi:MAG: EamA family transporter RarD [Alphaproteobacteria bacterium]|jgi:chloramphenicol-sensitive protein RarD|nr:EamA family transporter RarD [Alphaproteobacteria bacterium]